MLRKQTTGPEKRLWWALRHRLPPAGSHFRRQVPLGKYVADFCCLTAKLVIEVDGHQHGWDQEAARDAFRTAALEAQGYRVLRFTNRQVMIEIEAVLDTILAELVPKPPTPGPSPRGEGEVRAR